MIKFDSMTWPIELLQKSEIQYNGEKVYLLDSDKELLELFTGSNAKKSKIINVNPYGFLRILLLAIFFQLNGIREEIVKQNEENIQHLSVGQKVKLDGSIGLVKELNQDHRVKVKFSDMTYTLPKALIWRISVYNGNAKITKYKYRPISSIKKVRKIFSDIFNFDSIEIPAINTYKTLIVCNKNEMNSIEDIYIKGTPLIDLIPTAYYSNVDNFKRIGRDPLQRDPLFCFTSNIETAYEIIKADKDIKNLIIFGKKKILGNSVYIDEINNHSFDNISVIMDLKEMDFEIVSLIKTLGYEIVPEFIPNTPNDSMLFNSAVPNINLLSERNIIAKRLSCFERKFIQIESDVDKMLHSLKKKVLTLKKDFVENIYIMDMVRKTLGLLSFLRTMPIPMKELGDINPEFPYYRIVNDLESEKLNVLATTSEETFNTVNSIIKDIKSLLLFHNFQHPKEETLRKIISKLGSNDCIAVKKKNNDYLCTWIHREYPDLNIPIKTIKQIQKEEKFYHNIYILGWYDSDVFHLESKTKGQCEHYVFYKDERTSFNYYFQQFNKMISPFVIRNDTDNKVEPIDQGSELNDREYEDLNFIEENMETSLIKSYKTKGTPGDEESTLVFFEEDQFAFLTNGYNCRVLDREKETITLKSVSELRENDELVFVDTDKDVFNEVVNKMRESSEKINNLYVLSELWTNTLKKYQEKYGYTEISIANQLKEYGISRHPATILNWLKDSSVIGTGDAIEAISRLTNDKTLVNKLTDVKKACSQIRALHIKLGRYLANSIISSYNTNGNYTDKILKESVEDLTKNINIVQVQKKSSHKAYVPVLKTNKLLG
ncbi:DrmE family protein [Virgibacillus siamensis]|uniref:DrmE family protein n=1 Tax=Virgibacillus siamensis TaxID=480071 RepID=UPI000986870D|nr:DrmE family protein [Virgibacillus siamensis]